jgi:hypothetical protein
MESYLALVLFKIMASTGVLGHLVCALNSVNKGFQSELSMILTQGHAKPQLPKRGPSRKFHRARHRANNPLGEVIKW